MARPIDTELDPEGAYRDGMRQLIGARFGAVWKAVPVAKDGGDPMGVKDMRVASRRLRAAMDVGDGCFPDSWYKPLHRAAKEITTALGEVRDRDVLIEFLTREREEASPNERAGLDRLLVRIERERVSARAGMLEFLSKLDAGNIAAETERRFGPAAAPSLPGEQVDS